MDPYSETSNEQPAGLEATGAVAIEPDSSAAVGAVETVPGFDESRVLAGITPFAQEVPISEDFRDLRDVGVIEFAVAETVCGNDDRTEVSPATNTPWRWVCKLIVTLAHGSSGGCTGWFIGPRTLMEAGHCVLSHAAGGWVRQIDVVPSMDGSSGPSGSQTSTSSRSVNGRNRDQNEAFDSGAIIMLNTALGNHVGFFGFASLSDAAPQGTIPSNSGYPGDTPFGTRWFNADAIRRVTTRRLAYMLDTAGGQSGSVVWRFLDGQRHAVGIHG